MLDKEIHKKTIMDDIDQEIANMFDLSNRKKKNKNKKKNTENEEQPVKNPLEDMLDSCSYSYQELLEHLLDKISEFSGGKKTLIIKVPVIERLSVKKVLWKNFDEFCNNINRPNEHVYKYTISELSTEGSLANGSLVLKGRWTNKNIETIMKKYMNNYVQCALCHSCETEMTKNQDARIYVLSCLKCKGTRTLN